MCHNCNASMSFYNFLDKVDPLLLKEYQLERYKSGESGAKDNYKKPDFAEFKTQIPKFKKELGIPSIDSLPEAHFAKTYVRARKLPDESLKNLYYAEDFKSFVESLKIEKDGLITGDKRLVIPFYDKDKNLIGFQGRSLGESKLRYITVKMSDDENKVFGLDRIKLDKTVYVVEGPIDSLFIDNCVATADSNLTSITRVLDKSKVVLIFDNEPRNKDICRIMEKAIDEHYQVVIWPEMVEEKDINDIILAGFSQEEIQEIIDNHTHVNLRAKMEFINWKKV